MVKGLEIDNTIFLKNEVSLVILIFKETNPISTKYTLSPPIMNKSSCDKFNNLSTVNQKNVLLHSVDDQGTSYRLLMDPVWNNTLDKRAIEKVIDR